MNKLISCVCVFSVFIIMLFGFIITANAEDNTNPTDNNEEITEPAEKNGFYKENGSVFYYIKNEKQYGFLQIDGDKYYFDETGKIAVGLTSINNAEYYFDKNGKMKTGIIKIGKDKYYFKKSGKMAKGLINYKNNLYLFSKKDGKMRFGYIKYKKNHYYFKKKTGAAHKGFLTVKFKGKKIRKYFDKNGKLKHGSFKVGKVSYKSTKKIGKIYSYRNLAPALCQRPKLPTGCEIVSWTMMANFAGVKISMIEAAKAMPKSSDPNKGFMGSPFRSGGSGLIVYPNGLKSITKKYLGSFVNLSGCKISKIKEKLRKKHLVLLWVRGLDGFESHTIALTGYCKNTFFYNDPWTGKSSSMSENRMLRLWSGNSKRAMSY